MLDDEAATEQELNRLCGSENAFSYTRVPKRRTPVDVTTGGISPVPEAEREGAGVSRDVSVKSKILSHFIKGKISLSPMETVLMILGELENLESLREGEEIRTPPKIRFRQCLQPHRSREFASVRRIGTRLYTCL
jgi:hypothetical protein